MSDFINPMPDDRLPAANRSELASVQSQSGGYYSLQQNTFANVAYGRTSDWLQTIGRNKLRIFCAALLCGGAAILFTMMQKPRYVARTTFEVQLPNANFLNKGQIEPDANEYTADAYIQTQIEVLHSDALINRALQRLSRNEPRSPELLAALSNEKARKILANSLVVRPIRQTHVSELMVESPNPKFAADFANVLLQEFAEYDTETRIARMHRTEQFLSQQLRDVKTSLETAESKLEDYTRSSGMLVSSEKDDLAADRLRQIQQELSKAEAERLAKQSEYEVASAAKAESLPQVQDSSIVREYQGKLADLRRQAAELSSTMTPEHYKVQKVQAEIKELESIIAKERTAIVERMAKENQTARRKEELFNGAFREQHRVVVDQDLKSIQFSNLKRDVDANRGLYDAMLQHVKEAGIVSAMPSSHIQVIDVAEPPKAPSRRNIPLNGLLGFASGTVLGVVSVLLKDRANRSIRVPGESRVYLHVPELGVIPVRPNHRYLEAAALRSDARMDPASPTQRAPDSYPSSAFPTVRVKGSVAKAASRRSRQAMYDYSRRIPSFFSDSFRSILPSLLFSGIGEAPPRVLVITSAGPGEGKSTITANLALALAEVRHSVLVVDADMRHPTLHKIFGVENEQGLVNILTDEVPIEDYNLNSLTSERAGVSILVSGRCSRQNPLLIHSERMRSLLDRLRNQYKFVLIDTPPMVPFPEARALGHLADGVVLVIRAGHTTPEAAMAARQRLLEDSTTVFGTILNSCDPDLAHYGYNSYYARSYNSVG